MSSSTRSSGRARNIESLLSGSGGQARSIETLLSGNLAWSRNGESMAHLRPSRPASFEPRIVRASPESPCPPSTSAPALRTRRPSVGPPRLPTLSPSFPRPSYLDHSTLRHMLQTELPPALPPSRSADPQVLRFGPVSPSTDSDDDSTASPPRDPAPAPPPSVPASDHALRLPTRWSDQMKHSSLSVSADGRDLTFNGLFLTPISYHIHVFIVIQDQRLVVIGTQQQPERRILSRPHAAYTIMKFPSLAKGRKGNYLHFSAELQSPHYPPA